MIDIITVISKRNATFLKLPFFWRRVYTSESEFAGFWIIVGQRPRVTRENGHIKVAFLFEKSVERSFSTSQVNWGIKVQPGPIFSFCSYFFP